MTEWRERAGWRGQTTEQGPCGLSNHLDDDDSQQEGTAGLLGGGTCPLPLVGINLHGSLGAAKEEGDGWVRSETGLSS